MPLPDFQTIMLPLLEMFKDGEAKTTTQHDVGVTTEDSYVVKKIDSDYFSEE